MDFRHKAIIGVAGFALVGTLAYLLSKQRKHANNSRKKISLDDFHLDTRKLRELINQFQREMNLGLSDSSQPSSLKMLPSFVGKPSGHESGVFYALDLGGTNFRVISVPLEGNQQVNLARCKKTQFAIPSEAMTGTAEQLFNFIAESVGSCIENNSQQNPVALGFTFSFPVNQLSVNSGTLIKWTKGFTTQGVEGKDVVKLLEEAFQRKQIGAKIVALANDTVGTMMASSYSNLDCEMGVILGTGTNACYIESLSHMTKFQKTHTPSSFKEDNMIINMEWGAFGDQKSVLPLTLADKQLDADSVNPKAQLFEKMISGMYLGEISRLLLTQSIASGIILQNTPKNSAIYTAYAFQTSYLSDILGDTSSELSMCKDILEKHFGIDCSVGDRQAVHDVCRAVAERAARLSAAAIYAVLSKIGRTQKVKVAVDGSVFEHIPGFRSMMKDTLRELDSQSSIDLILSKDGSGIGAAIIAATVQGKST